jgi:1,4-dihydroxy-2-naphthoyl-CoA hydrolase
MSFDYEYIVQFRDTDAAGVVYFANIISICHVAYEASLIESGIDLKLFMNNSDFAIPVTQVSADFFRPLYCGDRIIIQLMPQAIDSCRFAIEYQILASIAKTSELENLQSSSRQQLASVITKHVAIDPLIRKRIELPNLLQNWLERWR